MPHVRADTGPAAVIHWHAYHETQRSDRHTRLRREPDAVLRTPHEVAKWLDARTRAHGDMTETWTNHVDGWVRIGDEDDLAHLRRENFQCASRRDSVYTDVFCRTARHNLYVEAVTGEQCPIHDTARARRRG